MDMKPGRELDALIAEKVMGWTDITESDSGGGQKYFGFESGISKQIPHFSKDISAAWEVVKNLGCRNFVLQFDEDYGVERRSGWTVVFDKVVCCEFVKSASHAICLAALKAVDGNAVDEFGKIHGRLK